MTQRITYQKGFTLIELAIALMIIGILLGGVLKGQELVENARVTSMIKQISDYDTAARVFRNTYGALPGDLKNAGTRLPNCTSDCAYAGTVPQPLGNMRLNLAVKQANFWRHMDRAGMISGATQENTNATIGMDFQIKASPLNPFGGFVGIWFADGTAGVESWFGHYFQVMEPMTTNGAAMFPERTVALDMKMDDGLPKTGSVRVLGTACNNGSGQYVTTNLTAECATYILSNSLND